MIGQNVVDEAVILRLSGGHIVVPLRIPLDDFHGLSGIGCQNLIDFAFRL